MPKLPSDNYSHEELAELLNLFGGSERYLKAHREWLWAIVESEEVAKVVKSERDRLAKKFPEAAKGKKDAPAIPSVPPMPLLPLSEL